MTIHLRDRLFLCSRADDGRGRGARQHFRQLESRGQTHPLHQDTREEEDLWQRQLPVPHRYHPLSVSSCGSLHWPNFCDFIELFCAFTPFRENPPNSRNHRCVCERWASVSFVWGERVWNSSWLQTHRFCVLMLVFSSTQREFEEAWGVKVFDRYSVVLHIFRCNARTKEAKLQISLAEIPLLR